MRPDHGPLVIKICGITSLEDAILAVEAGTDMLGFNFYPGSKRYILPAQCREIINGLKANHIEACAVGVFVNAPLDVIRATLEDCELDLAQLSGDEPAETLQGLAGAGYKALRIRDSAELQRSIGVYPRQGEPPAYLVDAYAPGEYGGTGSLANWPLAAQIAAKAPILLAGGLTPENVADAVAQVQPWGVDVASGVEAAPGRKDPAKVHQFVQRARQAAQLRRESPWKIT